MDCILCTEWFIFSHFVIDHLIFDIFLLLISLVIEKSSLLGGLKSEVKSH